MYIDCEGNWVSPHTSKDLLLQILKVGLVDRPFVRMIEVRAQRAKMVELPRVTSKNGGAFPKDLLRSSLRKVGWSYGEVPEMDTFPILEKSDLIPTMSDQVGRRISRIPESLRESEIIRGIGAALTSTQGRKKVAGAS